MNTSAQPRLDLTPCHMGQPYMVGVLGDDAAECLADIEQWQQQNPERFIRPHKTHAGLDGEQRRYGITFYAHPWTPEQGERFATEQGLKAALEKGEIRLQSLFASTAGRAEKSLQQYQQWHWVGQIIHPQPAHVSAPRRSGIEVKDRPPVMVREYFYWALQRDSGKATEDRRAKLCHMLSAGALEGAAVGTFPRWHEDYISAGKPIQSLEKIQEQAA